MRICSVRAGAAWALTASLVAGCESGPRRTPYSDNPLIQARQPLLQPQPVNGADQLAQVAQSGPRMVVVPPPGWSQQPATAVAAQTNPVQTPAAQQTYTPPAPIGGPPAPPAPPPIAIPTANAIVAPPPAPLPLPQSQPVPLTSAPAITPAAAIVPSTPAPVAQAVVRQVEGQYGHAPDHTWLQGVFDRHYRGYPELRFRAASEDDPLGGKVRLEDDPRLAEFRPGDVIAVEGELLSDPDGASQSWSQYRRFHIRAVKLVERK
jgi:hypothetical protein